MTVDSAAVLSVKASGDEQDKNDERSDADSVADDSSKKNAGLTVNVWSWHFIYDGKYLPTIGV